MAGEEETEDRGGEILAASILLALLSLRHAAGLSREAAERLDTLRAAILAEISAAALDTIQRPSVRQLRTDLLVAELDRLIARTYSQILRDLKADLEALAETVVEYNVTTLKAVTAEPVQEPPKDRVAAAIGAAVIAGAALGAWLSKGAGDTSFRVRRAVSDAAANGVGNADTALSIKLTFDAAKSNVDTIVRTAVTSTSAAAVDQVISANLGKAIQGWIWCSVLDGRTSELCRSRANLKFDADKQPIGHTKPWRLPPLHPNCRSQIIPWLMDSPAPRQPSLDEFLRSRPIFQQKSLVGPKQWELWRAGKITQSALLDQSAQPLSLAQVRKTLGL